MSELLSWGWLTGGGGDNGNTVSANVKIDNSPILGGTNKLIVATPVLSFVNTHRSESFTFAGVSGWWIQRGGELPVYTPAGAGADTPDGARQAPACFLNLAFIAWAPILTAIQ